VVGDPSREDAAADAVARAVWPGALADAALVDDHRVARDAAGVGVGDAAFFVVFADVEGAARSVALGV